MNEHRQNGKEYAPWIKGTALGNSHIYRIIPQLCGRKLKFKRKLQPYLGLRYLRKDLGNARVTGDRMESRKRRSERERNPQIPKRSPQTSALRREQEGPGGGACEEHVGDEARYQLKLIKRRRSCTTNPPRWEAFVKHYWLSVETAAAPYRQTLVPGLMSEQQMGNMYIVGIPEGEERTEKKYLKW